MFVDPYRIAKVGLAAAGTTLGVQVTTDKPPAQLVVNEYGQEEYFQDASMLEAGIKRATGIIEQIDAKVLAKFLYTAQKKAVEVGKEHKAMVNADPELRALMGPEVNERWDEELKDLARNLRSAELPTSMD
jgi:hypothetical protein